MPKWPLFTFWSWEDSGSRIGLEMPFNSLVFVRRLQNCWQSFYLNGQLSESSLWWIFQTSRLVPTKTSIINKQLSQVGSFPTHTFSFMMWKKEYRLFHETYPVLILLCSVYLDRPPPFRAWLLVHNRIITLKGCRETLVILFIKCFTEFLEYGCLVVSG